MTDLIERLHAFLAGNALLDEKDVAEAADEIELLRENAHYAKGTIERLETKTEQWRKLNSERVDEIAGLIHRLREAATANERLRADNLELVAIIARNETHYQAVRKLWVEACQERERIRAALQSFIKIGPRPWMDGGVSWAEWDAAMSAAESVADEKSSVLREQTE